MWSRLSLYGGSLHVLTTAPSPPHTGTGERGMPESERARVECRRSDSGPPPYPPPNPPLSCYMWSRLPLRRQHARAHHSALSSPHRYRRGLGEAYLLSSFLLTKNMNGSRSSIALSHLSHARSLSALHALMLSAPCPRCQLSRAARPPLISGVREGMPPLR